MKNIHLFTLFSIIAISFAIVACSSNTNTEEEISITSKTINLNLTYSISDEVSKTLKDKDFVVPENTTYPILVESDGINHWINFTTESNGIIFTLNNNHVIPGNTSQFNDLPSILKIFWLGNDQEYIFKSKEANKFCHSSVYDESIQSFITDSLGVSISSGNWVNANGEPVTNDSNCFDEIVSISQSAIATFTYCDVENIILSCNKDNLSLQLGPNQLYFTVFDNVTTENRKEIVDLLKYKGIDTSIVPSVILPGANYKIDFH